jgi:RES domain-containing protein
MEVFRLTRKKYSNTLSGVGASIHGARWNSPGFEIIYTSSNRALAMAEVAVHLSIDTLPEDFVMLTIEIPVDMMMLKSDPQPLSTDWNIFPYTSKTQIIGDEFIVKGEYYLLQVPSAVVKGEHNLLINPKHPDFSRIKIAKVEEFTFDRRLFM